MSLLIEPSPDARRVLVSFPYDPELVAAVKCVGACRYDGALKQWWLPARRDAIMAARPLVEDYGFEVAPALRELWRELSAGERATEVASRAEAGALDVEGLALELRPYQAAGVEYARHVHRCLLADEMGLGKTPQALAAVAAMDALPGVVVCPASLRRNWEREAGRWLPKTPCVVLDSTESECPPAGFTGLVVVGYEGMEAWGAALRTLKPQAVVFDEAHYLKNAKTKRHAAAMKLVRGVDVRLCLTGTPMPNRPQDLLGILQILGKVEEVGGVAPLPCAANALAWHRDKHNREPRGGEIAFWNFATRWCGAKQRSHGWDLSGKGDLEGLGRALRRACMVRRRKRDVATELPARKIETVQVDIANAGEYAEAAKDYAEYAARMAARDPAFLAMVNAIEDEDEREAAILQRMLRARDRVLNAEQLARLATLRRLSAEGKAGLADEWIESFLSSTGRKLVVFGWHREMTLGAAKRHGCPSVVGGMPPRAAQRAVDAFQRDPATRLIVCNIQSGGVGHTLTAASDAFFLELPWTAAALDQAIDRIHRIGQTQPCTAWLLMGRKTVDWSILSLIKQKRTAADAVGD